MSNFKIIGKISGLIFCIISFITSIILTLVGTGISRIEFNFDTHYILPKLISYLFLVAWIIYSACGYELKKCNKVCNIISIICAVILLNNTFVFITILFIDEEMIFFFTVQMAQFLLLSIFMLFNTIVKLIKYNPKTSGLKAIYILKICLLGLGVFLLRISNLISFFITDKYLFSFIMFTFLYFLLTIVFVFSVITSVKENNLSKNI